ncbi:hypothetical protein AOY81_23220 [Escherichia coli]|nr:hypothetical protein AOY81_23220 [Escherichia coli]
MLPVVIVGRRCFLFFFCYIDAYLPSTQLGDLLMKKTILALCLITTSLGAYAQTQKVAQLDGTLVLTDSCVVSAQLSAPKTYDLKSFVSKNNQLVTTVNFQENCGGKVYVKFTNLDGDMGFMTGDSGAKQTINYQESTGWSWDGKNELMYSNDGHEPLRIVTEKGTYNGQLKAETYHFSLDYGTWTE